MIFFAGPPNFYGTEFDGRNEEITGCFYEMLVAESGQFLNGRMEPAFNSEAGVRVLQWFVDFYKANQVSKRVQNYFLDGTRLVFASGAVKMNLGLAGWASFFNDPANSKVANKTCHVRAPK